MRLRGYFLPAYDPEIQGFNQSGGEFWIGFIDDDDTTHGIIKIDLTVWAPHSSGHNTFASLRVHYDGVKVLRELEEQGFIKRFEELKASTFYDVAQCCVLSDIPITYHGGEDFKEMTSRKMYEILYEKKS